MASVLRIVDLNGRTINIIKGQEQSWSDVVAKAKLPSRFDFCLRHWMSDDPLDIKMETRIKDYLDRVGYILIQDQPGGQIITDYKQLRDKIALVPVSSVNQLENLFYSHVDDEPETPTIDRDTSADMTKTEKKIYASLMQPRKVSKHITKLQEKRKRIDEMRRQHPSATVTFERVDTANEFVHDSKRFRIDDLPQYRAKIVKDDCLYDMDQVVCVEDHGDVLFYDQDFNSISGHVVEIT